MPAVCAAGLPHIRLGVMTTTAPTAAETQVPGVALDPSDPTRGCDRCGPGVRAVVLTGHGSDRGLTLAWCGHCFTARERLGMFARSVLRDLRS
ncbi:hypothetical protein CHO01_22940 [Cellulomonas hominis]|uniref:Uncharacterized protein n=1 Tax=Cellulomonas hominis TaxID=156981 RepID=A0A511FH53_9CELL|nr:hypothetical protein CHO01_22940 [Cellulomonas hominis]